MIAVNEALKLIEKQTSPLGTQTLSLLAARGSILASAVQSPINMPPFRQSAMDGYAIQLNGAAEYKVISESKAGDSGNLSLKSGEAVRIFTGALVPDDADTIVIQEHVERAADKILINKLPQKGANIRPVGEQVFTGTEVLKKGTLVNEATIGFLAGLGIQEIEVYKKPKVGILATGNELQEPGTPLEKGSIYESNAIMLQAALLRLGIDDIQVFKAKDDYDQTKTAISNALEKVDVLLISGGISVGEYDFVKQALEENGVEEVFYKVNQKPGKPLFFGKKSDQTVFALPGNPGSSLTCFYVYVLGALRKMMGHENFNLELKEAKITSEIKNPTGKTLFLKAIIENGKAEILTGQASSMLNSYAISNGLVVVPETVEQINEGDSIQYLNLVF
ncbi:gephyrin-like molybdotransferase Glp [Leeuwenhoekiella sp. A16]|uniref:molybdopterin molybdotransferase MoeA n=1 Tax=unclassified Leeuwenhoekiella TaxID=2615029 RepID=UPI003A805F0E